MTRINEPSIPDLLLHLLWLPVVALVYYVLRLAAWIDRGEG